jgi:FAD/FMN-containing dehydrogenase/Fe-S oxidoreductase
LAVDPPPPDRLRDDLKGLVRGELHFDDLTRSLYSTDASIFQVHPLGVALPRDEADLQALVRYAGEHRLPLVARGAGSGLAGEALGAGLIVDLSRSFRDIVALNGDTVRVQPGVTLRELNRRLAEVGRRFAPDPAHPECTLGGMLATNASGAHGLKHGYTRDHVARLRVVLDTGDAVEVGRQSRWPSAEGTPGRLEDIAGSTATLLEQNIDLIQSSRSRTPFNRCGYLLHDVLDGEYLDLARLLVGSEGTLALFTEATLRTIPLPGGRALVLLGFASLEAALKAARLALPSGPAACELVDRRLLRLARGSDSTVAAQIPATTETVLLVEYEADSAAAARQSAQGLTRALQRQERLAHLALTATTDEEMTRFWQIRQAALPSLYGLRGSAHPVPFVEDVGVPVEALPEYLHRVQQILQRHETTAVFLIHAATGQVHMRPFLDLQNPDELVHTWRLAEEVHDLVLELGGTISSQNGTGLARTPWVRKQYGGALYTVFRDLKAIFDPRYLFNPGKIVGPTPGRQLWPLRQPIRLERDHPPAEPPVRALRWGPDELTAEVLSCNGCGQCRTAAPGQRMCPIFRVRQDEPATPRAKANLMRRLLQPATDARLLSSTEVRQVADLCVNCKMCASECPAHVDIPKLMLEAKAANVAEHGLDRTEWVLARTEFFARLGSALAPLANAVLANPIARWLLERAFGISRQRRLPTFASRSFLRLAQRRGWTRKPTSNRPRVAYFVDVFANYNDPTIAEAVVAVLHHNGIEVYVPPGQYGCGMAPLTYGDVETAREMVQHNYRILADLARDDFVILCSEPTAALMFKHDALHLLDDPDAQLVAAQTVEFTAFLWELYQQGRLKTDFTRLELPLGHHVPCHVKALGQLPAGPALLALIPGLRVTTIDVNCSGMAGTFGLRAANYALSLEAGRPMLEELARPRVLFGSTECSTCRLQMEHGSGKRTLHPAQYLALAYGLLPELRDRLDEPMGDLVL